MLQHQITVLDACCLKRFFFLIHFPVSRKSSKCHFFIHSVTSQKKNKSPFCILVIITATSITSYLFAFYTECFPICLWLKFVCSFTCRKGSAVRAQPYPLGWSTQNSDIITLQTAHSTLPPIPAAARCPLCFSAVAVSWAEALLILLQQSEYPAHQKQCVKNS